VNSLRAFFDNATHQGCIVQLYCKVLDEVLGIDIHVTDAESRTSVEIAPKSRPKYSESKLHTKLIDIPGRKIQSWATHADGLHQYTVWFRDEIDIKDFVEKL